MRTQANQHGILIIDHSASPGVDAETSRRLGVPHVPEGKVGEYKTKSCAHCGTVVMINPLRTRERASCRKCGNKYVCDLCAAIGDCRPIAALADAVSSDRPLNPNSPLILRR